MSEAAVDDAYWMDSWQKPGGETALLPTSNREQYGRQPGFQLLEERAFDYRLQLQADARAHAWRGTRHDVSPSPTGPTAAFPAPGPGLTLTAISVSAITPTSARVNWTVQPSSATVVEYGTTTAYGTSTQPVVGAGALSCDLAGLTVMTLYHYRCAATANGQTTTSPDAHFTTSGLA